MSVTALRRSPLDGVHRDLEAKMVEFGGWEMPLSYPSGTLSEHMACREHGVVFDVSHLGTVRIAGPDAFSLIQHRLSNDLSRIGPGQAQYTHLLNEDGGVVDDIIVWWVRKDVFDVMPNASNTDRVTAALGGQDTTSTRAILAIQGPEARKLVADVFGEAADVGHFDVAELDWSGFGVVVAGTGYTGGDGIEIAVPVEGASDLMKGLLGAGLTPAGLGARDTLRLEAGLPLHGHELGPEITPLQARLGWVVGWTKNDFVGRAALASEKAAGPTRLLFGVVAADRRPLREGCVILSGDDIEIGHLTSGNFSPVLGRGIGLGFIEVGSGLGYGDEVEVTVRGRRQGATLGAPRMWVDA